MCSFNSKILRCDLKHVHLGRLDQQTVNILSQYAFRSRSTMFYVKVEVKLFIGKKQKFSSVSFRLYSSAPARNFLDGTLDIEMTKIACINDVMMGKYSLIITIGYSQTLIHSESIF